jgi:hypothetical protein
MNGLEINEVVELSRLYNLQGPNYNGSKPDSSRTF